MLALVLALGAIACSSSPRSADAFCRQGPLLVTAKRAVDATGPGDLIASKHRMAAFNEAIQTAVDVAPTSLLPDIEPLGKLWAEINRDVRTRPVHRRGRRRHPGCARSAPRDLRTIEPSGERLRGPALHLGRRDQVTARSRRPRWLRSAAVVIVVISPVVLSACSDGGSERGAADQAPPSPSPQLTRDRYCTAATALSARFSALLDVKDVPAARRALELTRVPLEQAARNAPSSEAADVKALTDAFALVESKLGSIDDSTSLDELGSALKPDLDAVQPALLRITSYSLDNCPGLLPTTTTTVPALAPVTSVDPTSS